MPSKLKNLTRQQARLIALLARHARNQRDKVLGNVPEVDLGELPPTRGERNPTMDLGFEPLSAEELEEAGLAEAINFLSPAARAELYALMRIGQGQLAASECHKGVSEAILLGDDTVAAIIVENPDLHDHIVKGLYETERS